MDFSRRSIAVARQSVNRARRRGKIRFLVADLAAPGFPQIAGRGFDFISCHGVLSYIARPDRALSNLARCLAPDGALHLGVNGASHFSVRGRPFLDAMGFEMSELRRDGRRLRDQLKLLETVPGYERGAIARQPVGYLASDLFGPLIHNLPLRDWTALCGEAGLHLLGSYETLRSLRPVLNGDLGGPLMPRSRADVYEIVELLMPSQFHRLVFARRAAPDPAWGNPRELLDWRPMTTGLYACRWPARRKSWRTLRSLELKSPATNTLMELRVPEWELEVLRRSGGEESLREILADIPVSVSSESLARRLYPLYQALLIDLLPPSRKRPASQRVFRNGTAIAQNDTALSRVVPRLAN